MGHVGRNPWMLVAIRISCYVRVGVGCGYCLDEGCTTHDTPTLGSYGRGRPDHAARLWKCFTPPLCESNNFSGSAAVAEILPSNECHSSQLLRQEMSWATVNVCVSDCEKKHINSPRTITCPAVHQVVLSATVNFIKVSLTVDIFITVLKYLPQPKGYVFTRVCLSICLSVC